MVGKTMEQEAKRNTVKLVLVISLITIFLLSMTSCSLFNLVSEDRDVSGFNKVALYGSADLFITQGDETSLTVEAQENLMPYIETTVSGGTLELRKKQVRHPKQWRGINYYLTVKDLDRISVYGSGDVISSDFVTDTTIVITIDGSGDVKLAGEAKKQEITIQGSADYSARDFKSSECIVKIFGSGDVTVNVTDSLDITIDGSGNVRYVGSPSVNQSIFGSGDVKNIK
ncbi:unnamed protein product [marine sediment metagenome]|uniref:Putative auto-transporter adhesin head GIN domain-containing protein n=1 Tax=marine sediment metagenome TaxID=412755 RepID=X0ZWI0_9ZZZZ